MKAVKFLLKVLATAVFALLLASCIFSTVLNTLNIGNFIGIAISLVVISLLWLYPKYKNIPPVRTTARVITALLIAGGLYFAVVSAFIISGMTNTPQPAVAAAGGAEEPQTVIVLGCLAKDGVPSQMLEARLIAAANYLDKHESAVCLVTGGQGSNETEPEAITMRRYLITAGISESRIYIEDNSRNTEENIKNAADVISEFSLPTSVIIVSDGYHLYRGTRHARSHGLTASAIDATPSYMYNVIPGYWIREIVAITRDYVYDIFGI